MKHPVTLRSCVAKTHTGMSHLRESLKLRFRSLVHRRQTHNWLQLLNSHPVFNDLVKSCPRLIFKIYRPYLSNTMNCRQRLTLLQEHYHFISRQGLGPIMLEAARGPVNLGSVSGKSGAQYAIRLHGSGAREREGEMVLELVSGEAPVYSIAFSFFNAERRHLVGVGGIQGPQGADGLALIREATRDLHGLRPKNLMLRLVRQLSYEYGCKDLILVGNQNRAVRASFRKGKVFADYNELWQEMGAYERSDGDFQLACEDLRPPVMEEIASKKRSEARKRHELLEEIIATVRTGLHAPRGRHLTPAPAPSPVVAGMPLPANGELAHIAA